jgi:DNA-binding MltR family transcriptional regulator
MSVPIKEFEAEINRVNRVLREIFKESGRAAALVVAAEIDRIVLKILESFLLPASAESSPFLERTGPIEALAVRIELLFRIGLIPPAMHHDLQLMRRIRNEFAHGPTGLDFNQSRVKKWALQLIVGRQQLQKMGSASKPNSPRRDSNPRDVFRLSASILLGHLSLLQHQIPAVKPLWPQFFKSGTSPQKPSMLAAE